MIGIKNFSSWPQLTQPLGRTEHLGLRFEEYFTAEGLAMATERIKCAVDALVIQVIALAAARAPDSVAQAALDPVVVAAQRGRPRVQLRVLGAHQAGAPRRLPDPLTHPQKALSALTPCPLELGARLRPAAPRLSRGARLTCTPRLCAHRLAWCTAASRASPVRHMPRFETPHWLARWVIRNPARSRTVARAVSMV